MRRFRPDNTVASSFADSRGRHRSLAPPTTVGTNEAVSRQFTGHVGQEFDLSAH
ncbi:hypothetical protein HMPREF1549_00323 [Actinomyces johnsonii F0510]|uniref:Uncharacterized protein n=1 Tax=Actinomyces johnsonii F0510 TaxID=1227262 RepID=U1RQQ9_9ACTO|nr:hypothetical protein HMPREF1549_00323 [Actinomyces johnsonii F0510]